MKINNLQGDIMIRTATTNDATALVNIYNNYITDTTITFELNPITADEMAGRMEKIIPTGMYIVYEEAGEILGYAYASTWRSRVAYKNSLETTVYLCDKAKGKGIGTKLYEELLIRMKKNNIHVAIGCITVPNPASIALHEKLGFDKVGIFKEVGYKFDQWLDVGFWQKKI